MDTWGAWLSPPSGILSVRGPAPNGGTWEERQARAQANGGLLGPPTIHPLSFQGLSETALNMLAPPELPQAIDDIAKSRTWGEAALPTGMGLLAAIGAVPGMKGSTKAGALAMDEASRLARAKALGFTQDAYHGTAGDIRAFDMARAGQTMPGPVSETGISVTSDPRVASHFAEIAARRQAELRAQAAALGEAPGNQVANPNVGPSVVPLKVKPGKQAVIRLGPNDTSGAIHGTILDAWDAGYDSVKLLNYNEIPGLGPTEMTILKRTNQARSRHAEFDPAKSHLPDLLAGIGVPAAAFGAFLLPPEERAY